MEEEVMQYGIDPRTGKTEAESGSVINRLFTLEQKVEHQRLQIDDLVKAVTHMASIVGVKL